MADIAWRKARNFFFSGNQLQLRKISKTTSRIRFSVEGLEQGSVRYFADASNRRYVASATHVRFV